jgi:amino acid adenylation domain-containing protein
MRPSVAVPEYLSGRLAAAVVDLGVPLEQVLAACFAALVVRCGPLAPATLEVSVGSQARVGRLHLPASTASLKELIDLAGDPRPADGTPDTVRFTCSGTPHRMPGAAAEGGVELALDVERTHGGDVLHWSMAATWLPEELADRLPDHYLHLLDAALTGPTAPVAELPLGVDDHQPASGPDRFEVGELVHEMVQRQARLRPDALAVSRGAEHVPYRELNARANKLARALREHGAGPETTVALLMERSVEMLVAFLAVFKSGAAAVLLDPSHPAERVRTAVAVARPAVLLTLGRLGGAPPVGDVPVIQVDVDWGRVHALPGTDLDVPVHADGLAYVVQTSGSTGVPKRVAVLHRSVAHSVQTHQEGHRIISADRGSWLAPPGSSVSVGELWPYLAAGASVHVAEPAVVGSPAALRDWIVRERITKTYVSMPLAEHLFELPWPADTALRILTVGSDKVRRWADPALPFEVAVAFGSSEANGISSCLVPWDRRLTSATAGRRRRESPPPVGRAWPDVRLWLLDAHLRPVPPGAVGELYVGGPELARGYLDAPALTADRFVPDPFGPPGERLYRTGDTAWRDSDGFLHYVGRVDHEVKVRGFRVNPGEVESALLAHPGVHDAVVMPVTHPDGSSQLAAYVVAAAGAEDLRRHMADRLPAHLRPAAYEFLGDLPVTTNGKVDRAALPPVNWQAERAAYEPPRDELEQSLVDLFAEVLRMDRVGVGDDFFLLGGDSLSGARLTSRLRSRLRHRVTLRALLKNPTPALLAEQLRSTTSARG